MTTNPSSRSRSYRQRSPMGKQLSTASRAAVALFLLVAISSIAAEGDINNGGGIDSNKQKKDAANSVPKAPSSLSSSSTDKVYIANGPVPHDGGARRGPRVRVAARETIATDDDNTNPQEKGTMNNSPTSNKSNGNTEKSQQPTANNIPPVVDDYDTFDDEEEEYSSKRIIQSFSTLFTPQVEEYTLTKFDPYSFSGAPLGGWGRATRSRLASLPLRLVSDYGGGFELKRPNTEEFWERGCDLFGSTVIVDNYDGTDIAECVMTKGGLKQMETMQEYFTVWGLTEEMFEEIWSGVPKVPNTNSNNDEETIGLSGFLQIFDRLDALYTNGGEVDDPWESTGPHFTLRDGMGRQFVCRAYDEGELEVDSYMNSMFSPAIRLGHSKDVFGDDQTKGDENAKGNSGRGGVKKNIKVEEEDGDLMDVMSPIVLDTVILDGIVDGNVAEALTTEIRNLLEDLEFTGQFDGDNIVIDIDMEEMNNRDISDIVKAAIQGASAVKKSSPSQSKSKPLSTQLTEDQIFRALKKLRGLCSQLHLGWWSYEWCHEDQVRQFHVDVSPDPTAADGRKYAIVDVTTIGHYQGVTEIINPVGMYNGELKKGWTSTFVVGDDKEMKLKSTSAHSAKEDNEYSRPFYDREKDMKTVMSNRLKNEMQQYKMAQATRLGNSGGIVKQQFSHGDMCDEVGVLREVSVEYRCCTAEEISHWLQAKRATDAKKLDNPLAVLVSVQEDETCVYRAKVCTPVLCPESLSQPEVAPSPTTPGKPATTHATNDGSEVGTQMGKEEAAEVVHRALNGFLGDLTDLKVIMGGEEMNDFMNELTRAAQNGEEFSKSNAFKKVIEAVGLGKQKLENSKLAMQMSSIDGKSIREVLESTLGARPCIAKNLGWWTYEYCHGVSIKQYHMNNLIDPNTGAQKMRVETEHLLGKYTDTLNYPNKEEHLHVVNVTGLSADMDIGRRNKRGALNIGGGGNQNEKGPGGNGAVFVQEYLHGDPCDHEDVAESVIKGGNIVHGSIERSTTVRFSCGKVLELVDIKEDSTCHYIIDVAVPALCNHPLFMAPVTKTQVVKCLPV